MLVNFFFNTKINEDERMSVKDFLKFKHQEKNRILKQPLTNCNKKIIFLSLDFCHFDAATFRRSM
jgi:hypothetical protein